MIPDGYANLSTLLEHQLAVYPEHRRYLEKRFKDASPEHLRLTDELAGNVLRIAGDEVRTICADYKWMVNWTLNEELYFRRNGCYRLSKFADAYAEVYSNIPLMTQYVNGILASQIWWRNHTEVLGYFRDTFVAGNPKGFRHLEVGPGHGLFLQLASASPNCASAEGWDVSPASIAATREALTRMGNRHKIDLVEMDITKPPARQFDSITFSEVLEHLEEPLAALKSLHGLLAPGGRIFVNAPANSPMPDHLYLFRSPEEVVDMMKEAGFDIVDTLFAPPTGASLEQARKQLLSVSAVVIGTRP
jgi:SAM-dependent methyltransferase